MYAPGEVLQSADKWKYPVNDILADQLKKQGLVQDTVRGTTSSSARRESPSKVFGISTPGRIHPRSRELNIGRWTTPGQDRQSTRTQFRHGRRCGDGTNQLTRLRTASGHQLLMHDTEGVVYMANGSGKAFIEMETDGTSKCVTPTEGSNMRTGQRLQPALGQARELPCKGQSELHGGAERKPQRGIQRTDDGEEFDTQFVTG